MNKDILSLVPAPTSINQFVRSFVITNERHDDDKIVSTAKPTGCNYLGWIVDGRVKTVYGGNNVIYSKKNDCHISGQIYKLNDVTLTISGAYKHIVAEFTPLGLYQLFGVKGEESVDRLILSSEFNSQLCEFFEELITKATELPITDIASRVSLFQEAIRARIPFALEVPDYLQQGVKALDSSNGTVKISELVEQLNITERQFNRKFTELVGIPPKFYARVLQMNKAMQAILQDDHAYLTEIAQAAGFFDQSHFIRVMHDFFESSPLEFLQSDEQILFKFIGRSRLG